MIQCPRYILSCMVDSYLIILTYNFTYLLAALQHFDYIQLPGNTMHWLKGVKANDARLGQLDAIYFDL